MTTAIALPDVAQKLIRLKALRDEAKTIEAEIDELKPDVAAALRQIGTEIQLPEIGQRANLVSPTNLVIPDMTTFYKLATRSVYHATTSRVTNGSALRALWDTGTLGRAVKAVTLVDATPYVRFDSLAVVG